MSMLELEVPRPKSKVRSDVPVQEPLVKNQQPSDSHVVTSLKNPISDNFDNKPPPGYYVDFSKYLCPFHLPSVPSLEAIPYPEGTNVSSGHILSIARAKLEELYIAQIEPIVSHERDGSNLDILQTREIPLQKHVNVHVDYLKALMNLPNTMDTTPLRFSWSPLTVGICGEECLVRYNLAVSLLKLANSEYTMLIPLQQVRLYGRKLRSSQISKGTTLDVWDQTKITKDKLKQIRALYSNALYELNTIQSRFVNDQMITNQHILTEAKTIHAEKTKKGLRTVTPGPYNIFTKLDHLATGLPLGEYNSRNLLVSNLLSPIMIRWLKANTELSLQHVIYCQAAAPPSQFPGTKGYHKMLFGLAEACVGKAERVEAILGDLGKLIKTQQKGPTIDEQKEAATSDYLEVTDLDGHIDNLGKLAKDLNKLVFLHGAQYYWCCSIYDQAVYMGLRLEKLVRQQSKSVPAPNGSVFANTSNNQSLITDDYNDEELDSDSVLSPTGSVTPLTMSRLASWLPTTRSSTTEVPSLMSNISSWLPIARPNVIKTRVRGPSDIFNGSCRTVNTRVYGQFISHLVAENNTIWHTGVTLQTKFTTGSSTNDPFQALRVLAGPIHINCTATPSNIRLGSGVITNAITNFGLDLLAKVIELKNHVETAKLKSISTTERKWLNLQNQYVRMFEAGIGKPLYGLGVEDELVMSIFLSLTAFYQEFYDKHSIEPSLGSV